MMRSSKGILQKKLMFIIQGKGSSIIELQEIPESTGLPAKCIYPRQKRAFSILQ